MRRIAAALSLLFVCAVTLEAQPRVEYRAFWVDTFNTLLNTPAQVTTVVNNAKAAKANALVVQVRRRGDSWFLNSLEPAPQGVALSVGFDALKELITQAHANGIEVHAFVIVAAVSDNNPAVNALQNPVHVFNRFGGFDRASGTIIAGPANWLTRTLLADNNAPGGANTIAFQGHRFGSPASTFWVDLGHPAAAQYTYDVLLHLVRSYDIDGLHLDRIRYPEISISGQTPSGGVNIGYNTTSVARFNQRYGLPLTNVPAQNDDNWEQWRRDQVTNFVRRVYLNAIAIKPQIKVSAALIAFGGIGSAESAWATAEANWRVYQDWRAWTEEGILDIAMPMAYKAEHTPAVAVQFDQWLNWLRTHQYNRAGVLGVGNLSNAIEGVLRQTRRVLQPAATAPGSNTAGVIFYSMATSNIAVTSNTFAIPPGPTPVRPFGEFASAVTTGKSVDGSRLYEPVAAGTPIFAETANIPVFSWKTAPTKGHLMGIAKRPDGTAIDSGAVTILNAETNAAVKTTRTDGNGFFGAVDLVPGRYSARVESSGGVFLSNCIADVAAGGVSRADAAPAQLAATDVLVTVTSGSCGSVVIPPPPEVIGVCGTFSLTSTRSDGAALNAPYPKGITTVSWTAVDASGMTLTATQKVTVTQIPQITAPANRNVATDAGSCAATVNAGTATSTNCAGYVVTGVRSDGAPLSAPYPRGVTTITWTTTEIGGYTASATQRITVTDNQPPVMTTPQDVVAPNDLNTCTATLSPASPITNDNCGAASVSVVGTRSDLAPLNAPYPVGITTITWQATDAAGLTSSVTQNIIVGDTQGPAISNVRADKKELWPPIGQMERVRVSYDTADNCSGVVTASLSVASNEPENGTGDGDTGPDWEIVDANTVQLRAERAGNGPGRIYTITVTATDVAGNVSSAATTVTVPHDQGNNN